MPRKLNDNIVLEIVTKHAYGASISNLAKEYGITRETVRRYLNDSAEISQEIIAKKTETVTEWLKAHTGQIQGILNLCVELLPEQLKKASARDIVGVYKVLTETHISTIESTHNNDSAEALDRLCEAIKGVANDE